MLDRTFDPWVVSRAGISWPGGSLTVARARVGTDAEAETETRTAEHKLIVTLAGGTSRTEIATECGTRYVGRDAPGAVSFVPAGRGRRARFGPGRMEYARLLIEPAGVASLLGEDAAAGAGGRPPEFLAASNVRDPLIEGAALALKDELERGGPQGTLFAQSAAAALALHLVRRYSDRAPAAAPRRAGGLPDRRLRAVVERMRAGLAEDLGLAELAAQANLSPDHFARAFRQATGKPPHRYLLELRVERARDLLLTTDRPIAEIAYAVGLSSQSHLTTLFRRFLNVTPHALRQAAGRGMLEPA